MLFLYRPRETWMPFARPMSRSQQAAYNRQPQAKFASTRRVPATLPESPQRDTLTALRELGTLHASGELRDAEFELAKANVLVTTNHLRATTLMRALRAAWRTTRTPFGHC